MVLIGTLSVIAMAFGPEIIKIFASKEYYDAIWVIPPVAASVYFIFLYSLFANIEFYFEKTKFVMIASCGGAIANIILNYIFIPIFGYYAAGYTTLVCYIMFSFAHYYFYLRVLKEHKEIGKIYNNKFIFGFSILILAFMFIMPMLYNDYNIRYCLILAMIIIVLMKRKYIFLAFKGIKKK